MFVNRKRKLEILIDSGFGPPADFDSVKSFQLPSEIIPSSDSRIHRSNGKNETISFNTFLKVSNITVLLVPFFYKSFLQLYWKIFGLILGQHYLSRSEIGNIRSILCSTDPNCLKQAKFLQSTGDWNKFLCAIVR